MKEWKWAIVILAIGLGLRLFRIDLPLATRAVDRELLTADITKALYVDGLTIQELRRFSDPLNTPYILEFPTYNLIVASVYKLTGGVNEVWGRLVSVAASLVAAIVLIALVKSYFDKSIAIASLFGFYLLSPLGWWMSRSFQPDSVLVMLGLMSVYWLRKWQLSFKGKFLWLSAIVFSWAVLTKLPIAFLGLPILVMLIRGLGKLWWKRWEFWGYWLIVFLPVWWWYGLNTSRQIMPFLFKINAGGEFEFRLSNYLILLTPRYWINNFYHLGLDVLTPVGVALGLIGLSFKNYYKKSLVFWVWLAAGGLVFLALPSLTLTQYYYYYPLLPAFSVIIGIGLDKLVLPKWMLILSAAAILPLTGRDALLKNYRVAAGNQSMFTVVERTNQFVPQGAWIVTSSAPILYYSNRQGWAVDLFWAYAEKKELEIIDQLENYRRQGAKYFISESREIVERLPEFSKYLQRYKQLIDSQNEFLIYRL